jgi:hypothetical protein
MRRSVPRHEVKATPLETVALAREFEDVNPLSER